MKESFGNFINKTEAEPKPIYSLEDRINFIKTNNIESFEDWSKKSFTEKLYLVDNMGAETTSSELQFKNNPEQATLSVDRDYDLMMRILNIPEYKEQSTLLYPSETKDPKGELYKYIDHKYPEELFNIDKEVLRFIERDHPQYAESFSSAIDVLKSHGLKKTSDWYTKSSQEKKEILLNDCFMMGYKPEIAKKSILISAKKYEKLLDDAYFSNIDFMSEYLLGTNKVVYALNYAHDNKDEMIIREEELNEKELYEAMDKSIRRNFPEIKNEDEIKELIGSLRKMH